jgi:hypothetical protein
VKIRHGRLGLDPLAYYFLTLHLPNTWHGLVVQAMARRQERVRAKSSRISFDGARAHEFKTVEKGMKNQFPPPNAPPSLRYIDVPGT